MAAEPALWQEEQSRRGKEPSPAGAEMMNTAPLSHTGILLTRFLNSLVRWLEAERLLAESAVSLLYRRQFVNRGICNCRQPPAIVQRGDGWKPTVVLWLAPSCTRRPILELVRRQSSYPSPQLAALGAGVIMMGQWEEAFIPLNNYLCVTTGFGLLSRLCAVFQRH